MLLEDAKSLVAGRLIDNYTCNYIGSERIFDKLIDDCGLLLNVSLEMEQMILVSLHQLYYLIDVTRHLNTIKIITQ